MEFNNKKLARTSKIINYTISTVLFLFLVSLSANIMDDVDDWKESPDVSQFENKTLIDKQDSIANTFDKQINEQKEKLENINKTLRIAQNNYSNEKESFENWLAARKTIGSPNEDSQVRTRANKLDEYYKVQQEWKEEQVNIENKINDLYDELYAVESVKNKERDRAYNELAIAMRKYDIKVFLYRLLFVLPILLIGLFFAFKFRKHKYWPLFLGFTWFSIYAFFFGLVPYLPSYGGYIRYTVGIILSVLAGIYAINKIKAFIEKKKAELTASSQERAKNVKTETAEKALDKHMCPSCGKDFIEQSWPEVANKKEKKQHKYGLITNFCRYCGLELFKKCSNCGTENFAHLPFCSNCGDKIMKD